MQGNALRVPFGAVPRTFILALVPGSLGYLRLPLGLRDVCEVGVHALRLRGVRLSVELGREYVRRWLPLRTYARGD